MLLIEGLLLLTLGSTLIGYGFINMNNPAQFINPGLYKTNIKVTKDEYSTGSCLAIGIVSLILAFYAFSIYKINSILLSTPFTIFSFFCFVICIASSIQIFKIPTT